MTGSDAVKCPLFVLKSLGLSLKVYATENCEAYVSNRRTCLVMMNPMVNGFVYLLQLDRID